MKHIKIYEQFNDFDPFGEESNGSRNLKIISTEYGLLLVTIDPNVKIESGKDCGISTYDEKFLVI